MCFIGATAYRICLGLTLPTHAHVTQNKCRIILCRLSSKNKLTIASNVFKLYTCDIENAIWSAVLHPTRGLHLGSSATDPSKPAHFRPRSLDGITTTSTGALLQPNFHPSSPSVPFAVSYTHREYIYILYLRLFVIRLPFLLVQLNRS